MAWECSKCQTKVAADDMVCPGCEAPKTAWTLVGGQTRAFRVSGRKLQLWRGQAAQPREAGEAISPEALVPAERVLVLSKEDALALAAQERLPAAQHVVHARLYPRQEADWTVNVFVNYETDEADALEFPRQADPEFDGKGYVDVPFVFVYGPETDPIAFPDLHVVDLSEETDEGYAPTVEFEALKKPPRELPVGLPDTYFLSARFTDRSGRQPAADRSFVVSGRAGTTDAEGVALLDALPGEDLEVEFEDGVAYVPAVHDPELRLVCSLRFVEPVESDEPTEPEDGPGDAFEPWAALALPQWLFPHGAHEDDEEPEGQAEDEDEDDHDHDAHHEGEPEVEEGLVLSLVLTDDGGAPLPGLTYTITWDGGEEPGETGEDGWLHEVLPSGLKTADLHVNDEVYELLLDQLDPLDHDDEAGQLRACQARLVNLGYDPGPVDGLYGPLTGAGLKAFQEDEGLEATGKLDDATRQALTNRHGC